MSERCGPFGWALVGLGRHTQRYLGPAITASETGRVVAVCSQDRDRATELGRAWGNPAVYSDLAEVLADEAVDGVFLVSPNHVHREQVEQVAAAGKAILCEKPLATNGPDSLAMVQVTGRYGVPLGVGYHLRHNLVHERARSLVASGDIGDLRFVSARYAHRTGRGAGRPASWRSDPALLGGGAFMGTGVHAVDLLRSITGGEVAEVTAVSDAPSPSAQETNLVASGRMTNDAVLLLQGGDLPYPENEIVLSGTLGTVRCTGSVGNAGAGTLTLTTGDGVTTYTPDPHDVYVRQCDDFVARVRAGIAPDACGVDGLRCAEIVDALHASIRSGRRTQVDHRPV